MGCLCRCFFCSVDTRAFFIHKQGREQVSLLCAGFCFFDWLRYWAQGRKLGGNYSAVYCGNCGNEQGSEIGAIGLAIESAITKKGFHPIKNLSGHGLDQYITHCYPTIPNYDNGDGEELKEGTIIAIEPFATEGVGMIKEQGIPEIFSMTSFKAMRVGFTRDILKYIEKKFKTLPFSKRSLYEKFSEAQVNYTLKKLNETEMVHEYAPLVERSGGMVTQAEHTLLVTKNGCEVLTKVV